MYVRLDPGTAGPSFAFPATHEPRIVRMLREVITEAVSSLFSSDVVQVFGFRNPLSNSRFLMIQGDRDEWFLCMYVVCRLKWYFGPSIGTDCFRGLLHALGRRHVCMFGGSLPCEHLLCNDDVLI